MGQSCFCYVYLIKTGRKAFWSKYLLVFVGLFPCYQSGIGPFLLASMFDTFIPVLVVMSGACTLEFVVHGMPAQASMAAGIWC